MNRKTVLLVSEVDWTYLWQRHQIWATLYARSGAEVFFLNKTGMRTPKISDFKYLMSRFFSGFLRRRKEEVRPPKGVQIRNDFFVPGSSAIATILNRLVFVPLFLRRLRKEINRSPDIVHFYQPNSATNEIFSTIDLSFSVYDCVQHFDLHPASSKESREIENRFVRKSNLVVCDSDFLAKKHSKIRSDVLKVGPGVDFNHFRSAWRGEEFKSLQHFVYYGHIRGDLDVGMLNKLADMNVRITLIGLLSLPESVFDKRITILPQVKYSDLPESIKSADVLLLPYKNNEFTKAIIPAKTYECLATGKPILASEFGSIKQLSEHVVYFEDKISKADMNAKIMSLQESTNDRVEYAKKHSWENQFARIWATIHSGKDSFFHEKLGKSNSHSGG